MATKRSRSNQARSDPRHLGIEFRGAHHRTKFMNIHERTFCVQKFAYGTTLRELLIYDHIRNLFANVGWQRILYLYALGYKQPSHELFYSVSLENYLLQFRMMNRDCAITVDQVCEIIGAPTQRTFGPNDNPPGYSAADFWAEITGLDGWDPKSTKASSIIHPLLKIAH